ncbi:MAG: hypothetical protein ACPGTG_04235 [Flavobacteriales bacterium]
MKKTIAIFGLFLVILCLQSCCTTESCPGLSQVEQADQGKA